MIRRTALLLAALTLLHGCGEPPAPQGKRPAAKPLTATATAVAGESFPLIVETLLEPWRQITLSAQEEGVLLDYPPTPGEVIAEGALIARLDSRLLGAEYAKARAQREDRAQNLRRLQGLRGQQAVSEEAIAAARTELKVAQSDEELLRIRLANTTITAPFGGTVSRRYSEVGNLVKLHDPLLDLLDLSALRGRARLGAELLPGLQPGDPVTIFTAEGGEVAATIYAIHPTVESSSGQGEVELRIAAPYGELRPGLWVEARFTIPTRSDVPRVPLAALRSDYRGDYLYVISGENRAERRTIHSGRYLGEWVEVTAGLAAGEAVAVSGLDALKTGIEVRLAPPAAEVGKAQPVETTP